MTEPAQTPMHDLIVVSDLHLGNGLNGETGRYHELEAFFYDDDFRGFCRHLCKEAERSSRPFRLVINGDGFDLLRLDRPAPLREGPPQVLTPERAARHMATILAGHHAWVDALAMVLEEGHEIVVLPGNHDVEVQWVPVQGAIRRAVLDRLEVRLREGDEPVAMDATPASECEERIAATLEGAWHRLRFEPWFYHEPGRIWVEHGCQYDPENAFEYFLRGHAEGSDDAVYEAESDMPLGNFFQKYLYNAFGSITFIVPSSRAHARYFKWFVMHRPRFLLRLVASHFGFWVAVIRRAVHRGRAARAVLRAAHERELAQLSERSGLGRKLLAIDGLKATGAGVGQAVRQFGRAAAVSVLMAVATSAAVFGLWFVGFHAIEELTTGVLTKALLFLMLDFALLVTLVVALGWFLVRAPGPRKMPLREAAERIAGIVDVPIVTFGHTHDEVLWRLRRRGEEPGWYFNTGTWLAVFTHEDLVPRERLQFTFLRVREHTGQLMHWSPGRRAPTPVILLEEETDPFNARDRQRS